MPLLNVTFIAYPQSANPSANTYINLHFLHPFVGSGETHINTANAIFNACFPHRFKISSVVLMYDNDTNVMTTNIKVRVNSSPSGNGTLTDTILTSASHTSTMRTQTINVSPHIIVDSGVFSAQISHSTSLSPETCVYFYGYQY